MDGIENLKFIYPKLPLRFFENRQIFDLRRRNLALHSAEPLELIDHQEESLFRNASVIIEKLHDALVAGRRHLFIRLTPIHHELNRAFPVLTDVAAGLDSTLDHALYFIGFFFDLLHARDNTAGGITEKFVSPRKHDEAHFFAEII